MFSDSAKKQLRAITSLNSLHSGELSDGGAAISPIERCYVAIYGKNNNYRVRLNNVLYCVDMPGNYLKENLSILLVSQNLTMWSIKFSKDCTT